MALLRAILELRAGLPHTDAPRGRVWAMHVNHRLRGEESTQDAQWLREQCDQLGAELVMLDASREPTADELADGVESYARELRYRLLGEACEQIGARLLAVGHTADDQVETVLLQILRGSGLRGASGMPPARPLTPSVTLVRPMLRCSRSEVIAYLNELGQLFRHDSSNDDTSLRRNLVRHDLLPRLREAFPAVDEALSRLAAQASESQALIEALAADLLSRCETPSGDPGRPIELVTAPLAEANELLAREALRLAWRGAGLPQQGMTHRWWCQLASLARGETGGVLNLPGGVRARVASGTLFLDVPADS